MKYFINKFYNFFLRPRKRVTNPMLKTPSYLNRHRGEDFLVLVSGKYLKEQERDIHDFIKRYQPRIIASNDLAWFTTPHYHSFFNRRRFCTFAHTICRESQIILSPYLAKHIIRHFYKGDYEYAMFRNEDNRTFEVADGIISSSCRSSALMNIGIAIVMGARNIYVAGLDGFIDVYNSYEGYIPDEPSSCTYDELRKVQGQYICLIQEYLKTKNKNPFCILTKTYFKDHYKDVRAFLK